MLNMGPGVSKTWVCAMACCHFICHPQKIRTVPGYPSPPLHSAPFRACEKLIHSSEADTRCAAVSVPKWIAEYERTHPFPVRNRKCIGNRGVNNHRTGWLRHTARVCYLAWEISNRFITLQRESGQAKFLATRAAGCEPENKGWLCQKTMYPSCRLKTGLSFVWQKFQVTSVT